MNCKNHPEKEAQALCIKCKQPICSDCTINVKGKTVCSQCIEEGLNIKDKYPDDVLPKRGLLSCLLFFFYSLIPGAAHMELGLFRRGLQIMSLAFGGMFFLDFIGLSSLFLLLIVPLWFFSFFESHFLRKKMEKGQRIEDKDLLNQTILNWSFVQKNGKIIGYVIIFLGIFSCIDYFTQYPLFQQAFVYSSIVKKTVINVIFILTGIYLVVKAKRMESHGEEIETKKTSEKV